jgi:hypothetical protein
MYLLPSEIFLSLYLLIPIALVAFQWRSSVGWVWLTMVGAAASWLFCNAALFLDPPDNGFAGLVYFATGWFWMLPPLWLLLAMDFIIHKICVKSGLLPLRQHFGGVVFRGISSVSLMVVLWGLVGWTSRERAIVEARRELSDQGCQIVGPEDAVFSNGRWIVRYPESGFKEICLTRNGRMFWIGGPG